MSETISITKILRPSFKAAVSPSLTRASLLGGFFIMRSETSNTASSSRTKTEQTFINKSHAYSEGKLNGFVLGSIATSFFSLAVDLLLNYLNLI